MRVANFYNGGSGSNLSSLPRALGKIRPAGREGMRMTGQSCSPREMRSESSFRQGSDARSIVNCRAAWLVHGVAGDLGRRLAGEDWRRRRVDDRPATT